MSEIGKHNVRAYLEACGKYQKYENSCEIEELTRLMDGYAQLYYNNQKQTNSVKKLHIQRVSNNEALDSSSEGVAICECDFVRISDNVIECTKCGEVIEFR